MAKAHAHSWQSLAQEMRQRIQAREWEPGELIPTEVDLAEDFGCARATVNRALRHLADQGLLDRRRKAGTRVTLHPVRKATLHIPIVRKEIEARHQDYGYLLLSAHEETPPSDVLGRMKLDAAAKLLKVRALHLADGKPFLLEDRWVNLAAIPALKSVDLTTISANEWLVMNAPFTTGHIAFAAMNADAEIAETLKVPLGTALFVVERTTWEGDAAITDARMIYGAGYRMRTEL